MYLLNCNWSVCFIFYCFMFILKIYINYVLTFNLGFLSKFQFLCQNKNLRSLVFSGLNLMKFKN